MNDSNSIINKVSEISEALKKIKRDGLISDDHVNVTLSLPAGVFEGDCAATTLTVSCPTGTKERFNKMGSLQNEGRLRILAKAFPGNEVVGEGDTSFSIDVQAFVTTPVGKRFRIDIDFLDGKTLSAESFDAIFSKLKPLLVGFG